MKIYLFNCGLFLLIVLMEFSFVCQAQDLTLIENGKYLKNTFSVNSDWVALPDLVAVENDKYFTSSKIKIISQNKNIYFYGRFKSIPVGVRTLQSIRTTISAHEKPVVYSHDRKILGMLSGNLIIKVRNKSDLEKVINDHDAFIVKLY